MTFNSSKCRSCKQLKVDHTNAICVGCLTEPMTLPNYEPAGNTRLARIHGASAEELADLFYKLDEKALYCIAGKDFEKCWNSDCRECIVCWLNETLKPDASLCVDDEEAAHE